MIQKEECEVLMSELISIASKFLKKSGEFYPIGCVMCNDGSIQHVAFHDGNEFPKSADVITNIRNLLIDSALKGEIKASGIAWDSKVVCPDNVTSDAVVISLEHKDDYSVTVVFPYRKSFYRRYKWKPLFASAGETLVFKSETVDN